MSALSKMKKAINRIDWNDVDEVKAAHKMLTKASAYAVSILEEEGELPAAKKASSKARKAAKKTPSKGRAHRSNGKGKKVNGHRKGHKNHRKPLRHHK